MAEELAETDRIERDLARTRARIDGRLEQLQEHLSPRQMLNDAFAHFRGGGGADFTHDLVNRAKSNPIPVALVGIGAAWMMASSHDRAIQPSVPHDDLEARFRHAESSVVRTDDEQDDVYRDRLDDARGKAVGVTRDVSDTAATYARRIKDALASASQSTIETSRGLASGARDAASRIGDAAGEGGSVFQKGMNSMTSSTRSALSSIAGNPLALGAIAAIVGLVAGSLLPTTDEEEHALGSVASKLRVAGRDLAQDVVDRGGRIASETVAAVKSSADAHGLTSDKAIGDIVQDARSGDLIGDVKQVAGDALQAGKDSAEKHLSATPAVR